MQKNNFAGKLTFLFLLITFVIFLYSSCSFPVIESYLNKGVRSSGIVTLSTSSSSTRCLPVEDK